MRKFVCATCGVQFSPSDQPPRACPICQDQRQYVPQSGQRWTTVEELRVEHRTEVRDDAGFTGLAALPRFAIGQRALLVPHVGRAAMWDCQTLIDDDGIAAVRAAGGLSAIAISHPHYYSAMVEWAHAFDCPILLHAEDARWIMRPDPAVQLWQGDRHELGDGLTLLRLGGHFAGGTVLHIERGSGTLLSGDIVQVIPDREYVSFMYSYPNLIPLAEPEVRRIVSRLAPFRFDRILGAWWNTLVPHDADAIVRRSAERYIEALNGNYPPGA
ncbi:MAG: MBL fold metallo-hydrolase [Microbacteriaceae bacterium]